MCIWRKSSNPSSCTGSSTAWRRASWPSRRPVPWSSRKATPPCWSRRSSGRRRTTTSSRSRSTSSRRCTPSAAFPGGYLKREARPSDKGTLTARMVDRPIRPGFVDGFKQRGARGVHDARGGQREPARHHLRHGRERRPHAGRGPLRRPCRLRAHRPRHRDGRVHREPDVRGVRALRPGAHHRRHGRLHLHGGGGRRRDLRAGHAGRHGVRPGGHRRVLRGAAALPRPRRTSSRSSGPSHVADPAIAERVAPFMRRDVRRAARRRQAVAHGQGGGAQGSASRPSSSPTRSAPPGRATSPPS